MRKPKDLNLLIRLYILMTSDIKADILKLFLPVLKLKFNSNGSNQLEKS